jgi:alkylhydroperoxidase family enzyme
MGDGIPRLGMEQLDRDLAAALAPRVARLGYLGEFFRCMGHQPAALRAFVDFTEALRGALPDALTEAVALAVTSRLGNVYERNQHERLSLKLGLSTEWVRAAREADGPGAAPPLSPAEAAVRRLALAIVERGGRGVAAELGAVVEAIGPQQAVAVLLLVGRFATHSLVVNALELAPPVASPLDDAGGGEHA